MVTVVDNRAAWVKSFKTIVCNTFKELKPQKGRLSKKTDCATFELEPHREYAQELYLECRLEASGLEPDAEALENESARIVLQLLEGNKAQAARVCEFLRGVAPAEWDVRLGKNGRRIYVTKSALPALDMTLHVSKQVENIKKYGETCVVLQRLWQTNVKEIDTLVAGK
jgi:hypothetical protein